MDSLIEINTYCYLIKYIICKEILCQIRIKTSAAYYDEFRVTMYQPIRERFRKFESPCNYHYASYISSVVSMYICNKNVPMKYQAMFGLTFSWKLFKENVQFVYSNCLELIPSQRKNLGRGSAENRAWFKILLKISQNFSNIVETDVRFPFAW